VALVTRGADDAPIAIHRTYLARNGVGKEPVDPSKMMLGPCRGGAVRLTEPGEVAKDADERCQQGGPRLGSSSQNRSAIHY
jgi:hypothetical protein